MGGAPGPIHANTRDKGLKTYVGVLSKGYSAGSQFFGFMHSPPSKTRVSGWVLMRTYIALETK